MKQAARKRASLPDFVDFLVALYIGQQFECREPIMSDSQETVANAARPIFDELKASLLPAYEHQFVSIEPVSREFFIGATISDAIEGARQKHPNRLVHTFRLGHTAAVHFGMQTR